jgi:hypothetical protein
MQRIRTIYVSAATVPFSPSQLGNLLARARGFNSSQGITGLLLYHQQSFFQVLEGPEQSVGSLYEIIERDPRHEKVLLLSKENITQRGFGDWSMGFVDIDRRGKPLLGFKELMHAKSSFLELQGDSSLLARLIDGFQEGRWRQSVEPLAA